MNTATASYTAARLTAWAGFTVGSLVSIAGNWLAAWLPATDMPPGWEPSLPSQAGAAVWPIALLISVEVLSRTPWQEGWQWALVRFGGVGIVAAGSAIISYGHIHAVLKAWGYDELGAGVGPLVIDGLMIVSGFSLLAISRLVLAARDVPHTTPQDVPEPAGPVVPESPQVTRATPSASPEAAAPAPVSPDPGVGAAPKPKTSRPAVPRAAAKRDETPEAAVKVPDEDVLAAIQDYRDRQDAWPSPYWVKTHLPVGYKRAEALVSQAQASRPALRPVREEAIG